VFTLCRQIANRQDGVQLVDRRPVNEIVAEELAIADPDEKENCNRFFNEVRDQSTFFYKFTLPILGAPNLLELLQSRGYDAGRLFPGYGGVAKAVENSARIAWLNSNDS
jgi:hypothetical protein